MTNMLLLNGVITPTFFHKKSTTNPWLQRIWWRWWRWWRRWWRWCRWWRWWRIVNSIRDQLRRPRHCCETPVCKISIPVTFSQACPDLPLQQLRHWTRFIFANTFMFWWFWTRDASHASAERIKAAAELLASQPWKLPTYPCCLWQLRIKDANSSHSCSGRKFL